MNEDYFRRIGQRLCREGLVTGNFGNMSTRVPDGFWITRSGSYLDDPGELVLCPMNGEPPRNASTEFRVHRETYRHTSFRAVVHAHPPHAVALSYSGAEITPVDSAGELQCPLIPVAEGKPGSDALAVSVSAALKRSPLVIARGHGTFAAGSSLEEAYLLTSLAEHSSKIILMLKNVRT